MSRIFRNQQGFTITELIVVIAISGILMSMAAVGLSIFFAKFDEMNQASDLQKGAFECLMKIKNGIPIGQGANIKWAGVNTNKSATFIGSSSLATSSSSIILKPDLTSPEHVNDYVKFYYDGKYVRATYLDGILQPASPLYIFPTPSRNNKIEVTKLLFTQANSHTDNQPARVLKVDLEARLKIGVKKYKYVKYSTQMALDKVSG